MVGHISLTGATDNRGNEFVVNKLLSSKFPLCCVLMELVEQMSLRRVALDLRWVPREDNVLADALSNFDTSAFAKDKEVPFNVGEFKWCVLRDMLEAGELMMSTRTDVVQGQAKRRRKLREEHPW